MNEFLKQLDKLGAETHTAVERFMKDEQMYLKYVRNFPDEPTMSRLQDAVEREDYDEAEKAVHALKGIVNNLGFIPLGDATIDMLAELRDHNVEAALDAYEDIQKQYKRYCDAILAWRSEG